MPCWLPVGPSTIVGLVLAIIPLVGLGANLKPALFIQGNDVSNSSGKILRSNIGCKKNIIENGAIMGEDVILREIGRDMMEFYWKGNEIMDNYSLVILSTGEHVLA